MVNSDAKKNGINVPPEIGRKPRFRKPILYSIIAVTVVVIVVVSVVVVLPHFTGPKFEFIPLSTAQKFTNTTLGESKVIILNLYIYYPNSTSKNFLLTKNYNSLYPPVLVQMVYLNSTNGSGTIGIAIYKFPSSSLSSQFYNGAVSNIINFTSAPLDLYSGHNLTFKGFKYSFVSDLNLSFGFAYKGSIFLSVLDQGIPINNFNAFMQAQISSMS
jgi:hypothetical protein